MLIYGILKNGIDEPICREGMERQMSRMDLWTQSGKKKMGQMEKVHAESLQSCLTLCDPMDHGLPGSSVHGNLQARILEWVAISFSSDKVWSEWSEWSEVAQSCPTLCDPMGCSLPGSSIHGILQARVLEWVAIAFSYGESSINVYKLPCAKWIAGEKLLYSAGSPAWWSVMTQKSGIWGGRWHTCNYGWIALLHGRNQHNIVKQLASN